MEVQLDKSYPLSVSSDRAWAVLTDIRAVAACMPGAQITEQVDATHYKGQVRSKVGPAVMSFAGDIEVLGLDAAQRRLELLGKGSDKGGSSAAMKLVARLEPGADGASSVLLGEATVTVNGKLAQFGGRLLVPIADAMLAQFAANFQTAAQAVAEAVDATAVSAAATGVEFSSPVAATTDLTDTASTAPDAAVVSIVPAMPAAIDAVVVATTTPPPAPAAMFAVPKAAPVSSPAPTELNALGLAWIVLRTWFQGLFGKKTA